MQKNYPTISATTDAKKIILQLVLPQIIFLTNIFCFDIHLYQHQWQVEKLEIVWKHDVQTAHNFEFFHFSRALIQLFAFIYLFSFIY